ncbi:glycosyltransferase family 2 protein [Romboutsia lituseburensis]|uniref:Glycosyl transferase family 2 n=1 Tax=Romboutsia lituseburensis DSM 797 TaxID=1121325 RepID=A0A1G9QMG6_9FIRM|nr:glycosyltransferase family 2 protein [Romboutsia lituseburensis]CEH35588.1 Glycosyltransferase, group 2 protein [Romboutsia lituseburensis]SDM12166.1 Glycosyl transferase family 2 [Romboutsia lituseburensis DSM 797]
MKYSLNQIQDLVSVITPVHNAEKYLKCTVDSVLGQTYKNLEIILVDDASKDSSREIIKQYQQKDERIKAILLDKNVGVADARNKGIEKAKGKYIAFVDSDDIWLETKIEEQINFMKKNNIAFSHTGYEFINENGDRLGKSVAVHYKLSYTDMLKSNGVGCLTVVIDKEKVDNIVMPKIRHEDYATWLSILKQGHEAYGINKVLALYRKTSTSLSGNKVKSAMWTWNILRNVEKVPLPKAVLYFSNYAVKNINKHFLKR